MKLDVHHLACHLKHQHVEKKTVKQKGTLLVTTPKHTPELTTLSPKEKVLGNITNNMKQSRKQTYSKLATDPSIVPKQTARYAESPGPRLQTHLIGLLALLTQIHNLT
jgi:hypothetical protein